MTVTKETKVLFARTFSTNKGGVTNFCNSILPYFPTKQLYVLEIGRSLKTRTKLYPLLDQFRFYKAIKRQKPNLIHLNPSLGFKSFFRDGLFAWQAKQMGGPLLIFWHGWDKDFETVVEKKYLGFFRRTFGRADGFIVLASEFERKLREWGVTVPVYRETTTVDESLVDGLDVLEKWAAPLRLSQVKILFLSRLERAKGVFETVEAIKILLDKNLPVCLTIAGDGEIRQELETFTRSLSLSPQQVHFTGDIRGEAKSCAFAEHHIYCFPTFYGEGLPTSVLEAMAFGLPVVTRPVGGLADIFVDGQMGALVRGKSPEEIAACLEKMITDQDKMAEIGRYNAIYAKEHFMASAVAKRLWGIYEELRCCKHL